MLGLAIGVAALVRAEALGLLVVLVIPAVLAAPVRRVARLALIWALALAVIAPWCVRNSTTFDQPMLVSSEDGPVIAGRELRPDLRRPRPRLLALGVRGPARARRTQRCGRDRLRAQGLDYARDHAARVPAVEGVRLLRTFGVWQPVRHVYFAEGRAMPGRPLGGRLRAGSCSRSASAGAMAAAPAAPGALRCCWRRWRSRIARR